MGRAGFKLGAKGLRSDPSPQPPSRLDSPVVFTAGPGLPRGERSALRLPPMAGARASLWKGKEALERCLLSRSAGEREEFEGLLTPVAPVYEEAVC